MIEPRKQRSLTHGLIVFVDDTEQLVNIASAMLEKLGCRVKGFVDSTDAFDYVRDNMADVSLVITDQSMPRLSGLALIRQIRALDDAPPVVLATSVHEPSRIKDYLAMGAHTVLAKPFTLEDLKRLLDEG